MRTNSNESGESFSMLSIFRVNATAVERFQKQSRNNLTVEKLNQMQNEGHRNVEIQRYRDIENRSINTIGNQLLEFRQKQHEKFTEIKKPHISPNPNENFQKWGRSTTLIGDLVLSGIEERRISKRNIKVKVKNFPGATIDDMYGYIKALFKKCPDNKMLHVQSPK